jgi:hypothetical protein
MVLSDKTANLPKLYRIDYQLMDKVINTMDECMVPLL